MMSIQDSYSSLGNNFRTQSDTQGNYKQKTKENVAVSNSVKGNKVELNLKKRDMDEEAEKAFDKMIRRPRSRKYMKALKMLDIISQGDEMIIAELKKEAGGSEEDELIFTPEDINDFKQRIQQIIEEEIRQEAEKLRSIIVPCYVQDDHVHLLIHESVLPDNCKASDFDNVENVGKVESMGKQYKFANDLIMKLGDKGKWTFVELYKYRLVHRNDKGDVIKIYRLDEEGNIEL